MTSERKFVTENLKRLLLKEYLKKRTERAGFGGLDIQRTPMGTRLTMIAERPGMVIGRRGVVIKAITRTVAEKFDFDNPQIEVQDAPNTNLNAQIMAQKLAVALERGWHFRRAGHSTVRRIMRSGARGCQIILSGKVTGARHRTEKFKQGHIKFCGEPAKQWMEEGFAVAKKKLGTIGIKVQIMNPDAKLPDEITVHEREDLPEEALQVPEELALPAPEEKVAIVTEDEEVTEIRVESVEEGEPEGESPPSEELSEEEKEPSEEEEAAKEAVAEETEAEEAEAEAEIEIETETKSEAAPEIEPEAADERAPEELLDEPVMESGEVGAQEGAEEVPEAALEDEEEPKLVPEEALDRPVPEQATEEDEGGQ